jgi:hypothetical protein
MRGLGEEEWRERGVEREREEWKEKEIEERSMGMIDMLV